MAKNAKAVEAVDKPHKEPPRINFRVPKGSKVSFDGFDSLKVGEDATIVIRGKVTEVAQNDRDDYWDSGIRVEVEPKKINGKGPAEDKMGIDDAVSGSQMFVD